MPDYGEATPIDPGLDTSATGPVVRDGNAPWQLVDLGGQQRQMRAPPITRILAAIIRLSTVGECVRIQCNDLDLVTVQVEGTTPSFAVGTIKHRVSNDGYTWFDLSGSTSITSEGVSASVTVTGYTHYRAEVTSAGTGYALVTVSGKSST